jgi:hypothetical protein
MINDNPYPSLSFDAKRADEFFNKNCIYAGKLGGIKYDAGYAKGCAADLRAWIGKGKSRKTLAMLSLLKQMEDKLDAIVKDAA